MSAQTSAMNGAPKPSASVSPASASRQQLKPTSAGKSLDGARKQTASPAENASRKPPPPKAWTQGTNPITQRSTVTSPAPNGLSNGAPKTKPQPSTPAETNTNDRHATDRLLFLLANYTGMDVHVALKNGEQFAGVFSAASTDPNEPRITLKFARTTSAAVDQVNGTAEPSDDYIGEGDDHIMTFDLQDVVDLSVSNLYLSASEAKTRDNNAPAFRTDVEISGNLNVRERELQRWQPSADTAINMSLEDSSAPGTWDQFAANEALYNVKSDYDENLYTTAINRADPEYRRKEAEAARIAREIERSAPASAHVAEERKMNADKDAGLDEEEKYSGVRRDVALSKGAPNAYVPPSRRPITNQPTVSGAPFDPAIISSQLARPSPSTASNSDSQAAFSKQQEQNKSQTNAQSDAPKEAPPSTAAPVSGLPTINVLPGVTATISASASAPKPASTAGISKGVTEGVERKVLDSFKQFSNNEKLRVQQHQRVLQERQRASARQEKSVKLNDLKKFAENFKLYSRVPDDLVPILAKTKEKQHEIVSKAETQAREKEVKVKSGQVSPVALAAKPDTSAMDSIKSQKVSPTAGRINVANDPSSPSQQRQRMSQTMPRNQPMPPHRAPAIRGGEMPAQQYRPNTNSVQVPSPIPLPDIRSPPTGPAPPRDITSPGSVTSAAKLNVKAMEFRPNPSASTFTPTSPPKVSPQPAKRPSISAAPPAKFFARKSEKTLSERSSLEDAFNPVKHLVDTTDSEKKSKDFVANGGIPQAYRTPPTWECAEGNRDRSYRDMFAHSLAAAVPPMHTPTNNIMAHQHQLPPHLQNGPPSMPASQTPRFYPPQPHHPGQHFDEHRMQYSSNTPSVQPSPRLPPAMTYGAQMHPQMQHFPGGMPPYTMSPGMQMRPMAAGQFPGPQGPPMGGHMMVQQHSNGPYMNGPMSQQVPVYASPVPGHVQPHFGGHPAPQQGPGFGRGHPMSHSGSQQGHPQQMYMMPPSGPMMMQQHPGQMPMRNFPQGQFQPQGQHGQHGYHMQRAMSNNNYNHQMTPRQHHAAPQQGPSPGMPPMQTGDEGK